MDPQIGDSRFGNSLPLDVLRLILSRTEPYITRQVCSQWRRATIANVRLGFAAARINLWRYEYILFHTEVPRVTDFLAAVIDESYKSVRCDSRRYDIYLESINPRTFAEMVRRASGIHHDSLIHKIVKFGSTGSVLNYVEGLLAARADPDVAARSHHKCPLHALYVRLLIGRRRWRRGKYANDESLLSTLQHLANMIRYESVTRRINSNSMMWPICRAAGRQQLLVMTLIAAWCRDRPLPLIVIQTLRHPRLEAMPACANFVRAITTAIWQRHGSFMTPDPRHMILPANWYC